jgi:hypothetical protein
MGDQPAVEERGGQQIDQQLQVCGLRDLAALLALAEHVEDGSAALRGEVGVQVREGGVAFGEVAKVLAGLAVAAPRLPRLKEWAYAGILINMLGAAASYLATGGGAGNYIPPLSFAALALTSWALRPPARRLPDNPIGPEQQAFGHRS